ncbi:MAG: Hsp20/alpha crystallin family protein [Hadesarchaea archaeon]|nr:Hsp20/alpha crystallin family protein [Hadesarchaea archaeon]
MSEKEKKKKPARELPKGLEIGGLLSGLGDFLSGIEELAKKAEEGETKSGEIGGKGLKAKYQYSVRTLEDEMSSRPRMGIPPRPRTGARPQVSFGKGVRTIGRPRSVARPPASKPKVLKAGAGEQESLIDVFDEGDHILVIAYLPDTREEDLKTEIVGNTLLITANTPQGEVRKDISIPRDTEVDSIKDVSFKNGVLQIKLSKKKREEYEA